MGVIVISGYVDSQAQPSTYKAPGDLYSSIFDPYAGLQRGDYEIPGEHIGPHGPHPDMPSEGQDQLFPYKTQNSCSMRTLKRQNLYLQGLIPGFSTSKSRERT